MHDKERAEEPDETAREHVAWVVGTREDAAESNHDGKSDEKRSGQPVEEEHGEGNCKRGASVVAGKGRIVRVRQVVYGRMALVWAIAMPDVRDQLVRQERESR